MSARALALWPHPLDGSVETFSVLELNIGAGMKLNVARERCGFTKEVLNPLFLRGHLRSANVFRNGSDGVKCGPGCPSSFEEHAHEFTCPNVIPREERNSSS